MAILVVCVTQAVDQIRVRKEAWSEAEALPVVEREGAALQLKKSIHGKMALVFVQNPVLYMVIVLLIAELARTHGWL